MSPPGVGIGVGLGVMVGVKVLLGWMVTVGVDDAIVLFVEVESIIRGMG